MENDIGNFDTFKTWLKKHLTEGPVTVIFTKKDGSERIMLCTTDDKLVPQAVHKTNTDNPINFPVERKLRRANNETAAVYDLESKAWKSFRWDSIKQVRIELE